MQHGDRRAETISLRLIEPRDLPALFEIQADRVASKMAGTKPRTREAFFAAWERIFADPRINSRVIEIGGPRGQAGSEIIGSISCFQAAAEGEHSGDRPGEGGMERHCIGYSIARAHWGKGIASHTLRTFLGEELRRPLHATTASSNAPSRRVLEKCGFRRLGSFMGEETDRYVACEITDYILE